MNVKRPIMRYHGGKWRLAPWIIEHMPQHRIYTEAFGGAGSVLLQKPRSYAEIYNDIDGEVVNLFRILRDHGDELRRDLFMTPYSRTEFELSYEPADDRIEQARRTMVRAAMVYGCNGFAKPGCFRYNSSREGTIPAHDWARLPEHIPVIVDRLRGVLIEQEDALKIIKSHDSPSTLHYVDPPYLASTRSEKVGYKNELDEAGHIALAQALQDVKGMSMVSGYPSPLYDELYTGWHRLSRPSNTTGGQRTEVLWLSPNIDIRRLL